MLRLPPRLVAGPIRGVIDAVAAARRCAASGGDPGKEKVVDQPVVENAQPPQLDQPSPCQDGAAQPTTVYEAGRLAAAASFLTKGAAAIAGTVARAVGVARPVTETKPPQRYAGATPPAGAMQSHRDEPADDRFDRLAEEIAASDAALGEPPGRRPLEERFPDAGEAAAAKAAVPAGGVAGGARKLAMAGGARKLAQEEDEEKDKGRGCGSV